MYRTFQSALCAGLVSLSFVTYPAVAEDFPVTLRGGDHTSFFPSTEAKPVALTEQYDAVIVGAGLAGMSAAFFLSEQGRKVLLVEKEDAIGGLAMGSMTADGIPYNRGASYWTKAYDEEEEILQMIGLSQYEERFAIHEPIDSYLWNGELYLGVWEHESLERLPASFALFKNELEKADSAGMVVNQPMEDAKKKDLDSLSAADWVRSMPALAAKRRDKESVAIYKKFRADKRVDPADPMLDVLNFLQTYTRSALGSTPDQLSAMAFANFYISELETRYTSSFGTGEATRVMERILRDRPNLVHIRTKTLATRMTQDDQGVTTRIVDEKGVWDAKSKYAVYAAQLKFAPRIIDGLAQLDPEKVKTIEALQYSHYVVHVLSVKGHPYRATFDTWIRPKDYRPTDFTDLILARWQDPSIRGYEGMRDFKSNPADDRGLIALYHPFFHNFNEAGAKVPEKHFENIARGAVKRMHENFDDLLKKTWGTSIEVESVETNRWPYSIHVAGPGHLTKSAPLLRRPVKRIYFANNNIGTPAFEEALFRGHCAANNLMKKFDANFRQEKWTRCRIE